MPHSWFNIDEKNNRIYINTFHADIDDELVSAAVLPLRNYMDNALADEITQQLGANFDVIYAANTLQTEVTTNGVLTFTQCDRHIPKSFNTVINIRVEQGG